MSNKPLDAVPPPVSAVDPHLPRQGHAPLARVAAAAALTTLVDQAVFRLIRSDDEQPPVGELFRFRRGSRLRQPILSLQPL
ncbi:hypothetical protein [Flavisphingomonas formosensis]|uniref:hypothetical protein n=1 Tax=Flavisphingomonas formosensis TaxID=861534 RepID=UPI0012F84B48|nr:hypothetical protein [Sphingomonas formosensis]